MNSYLASTCGHLPMNLFVVLDKFGINLPYVGRQLDLHDELVEATIWFTALHSLQLRIADALLPRLYFCKSSCEKRHTYNKLDDIIGNCRGSQIHVTVDTILYGHRTIKVEIVPPCFNFHLLPILFLWQGNKLSITTRMLNREENSGPEVRFEPAITVSGGSRAIHCTNRGPRLAFLSAKI